MRCWLLVMSFLCTLATARAQDSARGLTIITRPGAPQGTTRALIVGISAYQNLPSLQYADKDAQEFAYYLSANKSWQVDPANIRLLTNDQAKAGDILSWLMWLLENSKAGDNIVFYFSGHGDVETSQDVNKGYLLAHDAPKNNYVAGGAIAVDLLRQIYSEIIDKGVKLYMVTDACRAGHLAGGSGGSRITAQAFSRQWRNETKILSAQPDELSYEGRQWGGGRGVFSFFLTKGLSGYADLNKDSSITLAEIEQYVGLQVAEETSYKQQPVFEGASKFSQKISRVDPGGMDRNGQYKSGNITVAVVAEKGAARVEAGNCGDVYDQFRLTLQELGDSLAIAKAVGAYEQLARCDNESLRHQARFQLTAALMNYVQQIVNQTLVGQKLIGPEELQEGLAVIGTIYRVNGDKRLVNKDHLDNIRRYFTINHTSFWSEAQVTPTQQAEMLRMLDSALVLEPGAAYLELSRGILLMNGGEYDSALVYFRKAIEHSPTWLMPYYFAAQALGYSDKPAEALRYMEQVLALDSTYQSFECAKCFYNLMGSFYLATRQYEKAERSLLLAAKDPEFAEPLVSLIQLYHERKKYPQRDQYLRKLRQESTTVNDRLLLFQLELEMGMVENKAGEALLDSLTEAAGDEDLALLFYTRARWAEARKRDPVDDYRSAHEAAPADFDYAAALIAALTERGEFEEAEELITALGHRLNRTERLRLDFYHAMCYTYTGREAQALALFKTLIDGGFMACKEIRQLKPLRKLAEYQALVKGCR